VAGGGVRRAIAGIALLLLLAGSDAAAAKIRPGSPGSVRFVKPAESDFAPFLARPSRSRRAWMARKYWRMRTYPPWFDRRTRWYRRAWAYRDLYAIYRGHRTARRRPSWILRDARGRRLYIPFACDGSACPQYAGDITSAAFRRHWIRSARRTLRKGYIGLFIDDVNTPMAVGDGTGRWVPPIDRRTGRPMTPRAWRRYLAIFTQQIRRAFPRAEIVHNSLWVAGDADRWTRLQLRSADLIELERGANDRGMRGGWGPFGYERFLAFIDRMHARGKGVLLDGRARTDGAREYGLASYFLISNGRDAIGNDPPRLRARLRAG